MGKALWDSDVTLYVEAAFSAATGDYGVWDVGKWDSATWGPDLVWTDITADALEVTSKIGRDREFEHFRAATGAVVLENISADYSPQNLSGPYVAAGVTGVRPWRPIRGYATYQGATFPLFYGYAEDFQDDLSTRIPKMVIPWVGGIAKLAKFDGFEQSSQGSGEPAGVRMHRILDNVGWTRGRTIDVSGTLVQPTTLARNAWTEILLTADSDGGEVWVDPDGTFIFQHAGHPYEDPRQTTSQATFTDSDTPGALHYEKFFPTFTGDLLVNIAKLSRAGGTEQTIADNTSRDLYEVEALFSRNDLICTTDSQVLSLATRMVALRAQAESRVAAITLHPRIYPELWEYVLGLRIKDRITVEHHHSITGQLETYECFIDGIEHDISEAGWMTTLRTGSAAGFVSSGELGSWDSGVWDEAVWGW